MSKTDGDRAGRVNLSEVERLWLQQVAVFGAPASDSTIHRTLQQVEDHLLAKVARARARVRSHVWGLPHLRPGGFPWLVVAGKRLTGWIVIDIDATLIGCRSDKQGAAVTFKNRFGHHPLKEQHRTTGPMEPGAAAATREGPAPHPRDERASTGRHIIRSRPRRIDFKARVRSGVAPDTNSS